MFAPAPPEGINPTRSSKVVVREHKGRPTKSSERKYNEVTVKLSKSNRDKVLSKKRRLGVVPPAPEVTPSTSAGVASSSFTSWSTIAPHGLPTVGVAVTTGDVVIGSAGAGYAEGKGESAHGAEGKGSFTLGGRSLDQHYDSDYEDELEHVKKMEQDRIDAISYSDFLATLKKFHSAINAFDSQDSIVEIRKALSKIDTKFTTKCISVCIEQKIHVMCVRLIKDIMTSPTAPPSFATETTAGTVPSMPGAPGAMTASQKTTTVGNIVWTLINITSASDCSVGILEMIEAGLFPILIELLKVDDLEIIGNVIWMVANIAGEDSFECRTKLFESGIIDAMLPVFSKVANTPPPTVHIVPTSTAGSGITTTFGGVGTAPGIGSSDAEIKARIEASVEAAAKYKEAVTNIAFCCKNLFLIHKEGEGKEGEVARGTRGARKTVSAHEMDAMLLKAYVGTLDKVMPIFPWLFTIIAVGDIKDCLSFLDSFSMIDEFAPLFLKPSNGILPMLVKLMMNLKLSKVWNLSLSILMNVSDGEDDKARLIIQTPLLDQALKFVLVNAADNSVTPLAPLYGVMSNLVCSDEATRQWVIDNGYLTAAIKSKHWSARCVIERSYFIGNFFDNAITVNRSQPLLIGAIKEGALGTIVELIKRSDATMAHLCELLKTIVLILRWNASRFVIEQFEQLELPQILNGLDDSENEEVGSLAESISKYFEKDEEVDLTAAVDAATSSAAGVATSGVAGAGGHTSISTMGSGASNVSGWLSSLATGVVKDRSSTFGFAPPTLTTPFSL